jgi:signal peptidase II
MRTEAGREQLLEAANVPTVPVAALTAPSVGDANAPPDSATDRKHFKMRLLVVGAIAVIGLGWDLWTKHEVFARLGCPGEVFAELDRPGLHPVWKGQLLGVSIRFELRTTLNHGALWGMGQGQTWLFATLSLVAVGAIAYFLWNRQAIASRWLTVVTGLLLAGTLGNLFDRLGLHGLRDRRGVAVYAVRDFLDFWFFNDGFHWATFNFADSYLVVGACMLVLHSFWIPPAEAAAAK